MKYQRIIAEIFARPWAILPEKLQAIAEFAAFAGGGGKFSEEDVRARVGAGPRPRPSTPGTVALLDVFGVISNRMNMMSDISGGTSIEKLTAQFRAALADPSVKAIVFDVDSPGGSVDGVPELADEIYSARAQKKTVAVANTMAASAAYWIASAADELVVTPSGSVGSIGVFAAHEDMSKYLDEQGVKISLVSAGKYKTEGNPYEPLSEDAKASMQTEVNAFYDMFVKAVAKNRGTQPAAVRSGFGQGRMVLAADAVGENMATRVATLDQTLARFGVAKPTSAMRASRELDLIA
jgi:signal peptide peptidase SppA